MNNILPENEERRQSIPMDRYDETEEVVGLSHLVALGAMAIGTRS